MVPHLPRSGAALAALGLLLAGCTSNGGSAAPAPAQAGSSTPAPTSPKPSVAPVEGAPTTGIPPALDPGDLYAADRPGLLSAQARTARSLVYVPNSNDNTVTVIDPQTYRVLRTVRTGRLPQHVTPSYDEKVLWVDNDLGNSLTRIDPKTGSLGRTVPVDDPYNLYFTADGRHAVVVAEQRRRLDFRDPQTMKLQHALKVPCPGVDHMDFSADGTHALVSCEFGAKMIWVDMQRQKVVKSLALRPGSMPQDVKTSPDGKIFYVADMTGAGVYLIDARTIQVIGFLHTGSNAHGIYVSRDSKTLYVTNRLGHSVSLVDVATRKVRDTWPIPGGTPDMGGVSSDGKTLWLSGRYTSEVYAIDTANGRLRARIPVGRGPHGLSVWPQPGRYSLGHNGVLR